MRSIIFVGAGSLALILLLCAIVGLGRRDGKLDQAQYHWFQEADWVLEGQQEKLAHLHTLVGRIDELEKLGKAGRIELNQRYIWQQSVSQVIQDHNALAKEYNYRMAKLQWKFCNTRSLPAGFTQSLPRMFPLCVAPRAGAWIETFR